MESYRITPIEIRTRLENHSKVEFDWQERTRRQITDDETLTTRPCLGLRQGAGAREGKDTPYPGAGRAVRGDTAGDPDLPYSGHYCAKRPWRRIMVPSRLRSPFVFHMRPQVYHCPPPPGRRGFGGTHAPWSRIGTGHRSRNTDWHRLPGFDGGGTPRDIGKIGKRQ